MYPQVIRALFGDDKVEPLQLNNPIEVQIFLKKAHRLYWNAAADLKSPNWGLLHQTEWHFCDEETYSEAFVSLRIAEQTNLSLLEFLNLDFYFANYLIKRATERAEKEIEQEKKRKEEEMRKLEREKNKERMQRIRRGSR